MFDHISVSVSVQEVHDQIIQAYHKIKKVKMESALSWLSSNHFIKSIFLSFLV